ncbi:putative fatty acid transporter protein [Rosellinia necatrix]|uniref:Putative fatty acid transporter protein n=1 Tax=Rosellinia necatrix TaxID=77044 RepID=A0A1W2TAL7_ROSNE|nr:putative fatty acid transporter protein [Rosellinia necatrix]
MNILDFVRAAVAYLDKNSALQSFKAFFQQKRYGSELDDAIDSMKEASASFENCVSVCFQLRIQKIDRNVDNLKNPIFGIYFLLAGILKDFPYQLEQLKTEMRNATMMHTLQLIQIPIASPSISTANLQQLLSGGDWQTAVMSVTEDLNRARNYVPSLLDQEKIGLLMSNNEFVAWIRSLASGLVILHDEGALGGNSSLSALSYLSAIISGMLRGPGMLSLTFFCGLHCASISTLEGGYGIVRSLALQLLPLFENMNLNTACDPNLVIQGLMMNDLSTMCSVFTMLLQNIPAGVIYIIIDGAYWYATEARGEGMQGVILFLNQLVMEVQAASRGLVLKVLVTNPTVRQRNTWGFPACDIHLDQSLLTGGHRGTIRRG